MAIKLVARAVDAGGAGRGEGAGFDPRLSPFPGAKELLLNAGWAGNELEMLNWRTCAGVELAPLSAPDRLSSS